MSREGKNSWHFSKAASTRLSLFSEKEMSFASKEMMLILFDFSFLLVYPKTQRDYNLWVNSTSAWESGTDG